ncbi:DUF333 domain-containing protein [Candidatus Uhrbacteria bacterium]|nr:DUF333 domain-containing protein [Candidatus Uhrbacteria bacterium]
MKHRKDTSALFWILLGGSFVLIVILWLPMLKKNVLALTSSMSSEVVTPTSDMVQQLTNIRNSFDTYFKETYKKLEQSTTNAVLEKAADNLKKELDTSTQATLPTADTRETPVPMQASDTKKFCTKQGGYEQERKGPGHLVYHVCIFSDGSECEEYAFMNGQCHKGQYTVAEKGIIQKADLSVAVEKAGYCTSQNGTERWIEKNEAKTMCIKNLAIVNSGWTSSPRSYATVNNAFYAVPQLEPGASHVVMEMLTIPKVSDTTTARVTADAKKQIDELSETNNTFIFPENK